MKIAGLSDRGKVRTNNEDTMIFDQDLGLMVVADGMGGHNSGEVASQLAVNVLSQQIKRSLKTGHVPVFYHVPPDPSLDPRSLILGDCIKFSNMAVYEAAQKNPANKNMGTTLVAALWLGEKMAVAHVGDSRLYMIRQGDITQCTVDHSFVQEQLDKGLINKEDAEKSEMKNLLTRAVGNQEDVAVDVREIPLEEGDYILLCSDGLSKMLTDEEIAAAFKETEDPDIIAQKLIDNAIAAGGADNVTAIVARLQGAPGSWTSLTDRIKKIFGKTSAENN